MPVDSNSTFHGTAIVVGETGLLITGPSGAGKTMLAMRCLHAARSRGWNSSLIGDDRVRLEVASGRLIARSPAAISGLAEIRGSGVVPVSARFSAVVQLIVAPGVANGSDRVPVENETAEINGLSLPLVRLLYNAAADPLAVICTCAPRFFPGADAGLHC